MKCPNCGSTAQPRIIDTEYSEGRWEIEVTHTYKCGCGCKFLGITTYQCQTCDEFIVKLPVKNS